MHGSGGKGKVSSRKDKAYQHKIFLDEGESGPRRGSDKAFGNETYVCESTDQACPRVAVCQRERRNYRMVQCVITDVLLLLS